MNVLHIKSSVNVIFDITMPLGYPQKSLQHYKSIIIATDQRNTIGRRMVYMHRH